MKDKNTYCTGCGLCKNLYKDEIQVKRELGFDYYYLDSEKMKYLKDNICMSSGKQTKSYSGDLWGKSLETTLSWANNKEIRYLGSSGGTITALASYLLDFHIVDGIIHIANKKDSPTEYEYVITFNSNDLIKSVGSKYIDTSNLANILDLLEEGKKYCFIGKPCDVITLKNYSINDERVRNTISIYISFFCAGSPSVDATYTLVKDLGCDNKELKSINYRGSGWPGITTIVDNHGKEYITNYAVSWGKYLGRNIRKSCRFCLDGIGEFADISCGDAWYVKDNEPDFSEHEGRNITFLRTNIGKDVFYNAVQNGYLVVDNIENNEEYLSIIQKYQLERRTTMNSMISALKCFNYEVPKYDKTLLRKYSKKGKLKIKTKRFLGTIKRVLKHKI